MSPLIESAGSAAVQVLRWLLVASVQFVCLAPAVAAFDRLMRDRLTAEQRAWPWRIALLAPLLPMPVVPRVVALPQWAVLPADAGISTAEVVALFVWATVALVGAVAGARLSREQRRRLLRASVPANEGWHRALATVAARMRLRTRRDLAAWYVPMRGVDVRFGADDSGPCVLGWRYPVVLVPRRFADLSPSARAHVLAHELAHVARFDGLRRQCLIGLQLAFWCHPVVWLVASRLRAFAEMACDARAVRTTDGGFAATLRACAGAMLATPPAALPAMVGGVEPLRSRLRALRRPPTASGIRPWAAVVACGLLLVVVTPSVAAPLCAFDGSRLPGCLRQRWMVFTELAHEASVQPR